MLDDLFIIYANNSFRENPENISKVFDEIYPYLGPIQYQYHKRSLEMFIDPLITFYKDNDPKIADQRRTELCRNEYYSSPVGLNARYELDVAYEAVYRYRDGYCPKRCISHYGRDLAKTAESLDYGGNQRLKCLECQQFYFRNLLTQLVIGNSLRDLNCPVGDIVIARFGFEKYLKNAHDSVKEKLVLTNDDELHRKKYISTNLLLFKHSRYLIHDRYNEYIAGLVGYSLTNFLLHNERTKLKQCRRKCDKFFIASKNDDRIKFCSDCSQKSKKSKAEKAEYMKQYRIKKKRNRITQEREAKITNYVDNLGCTREEAIKIIETDAMM